MYSLLRKIVSLVNTKKNVGRYKLLIVWKIFKKIINHKFVKKWILSCRETINKRISIFMCSHI